MLSLCWCHPAAAAGVHLALFSWFWQSSPSLALAVGLNWGLGKLNERVRKAFSGETTFEGRLRAVIHAWFDHIEQDGILMGRLLQATRNDGPHVEARNAYNRFNEKWWADLAERELGVPNSKGQIATAILLSGLEGIVQRWVQCGDSRDELEDVFMTVAMGGLHNLSS